MPAACERMSERCSWARSSGEMCRLASAPNPVEMPYTGSAERGERVDLRAASTAIAGERRSAISSTRASPRATAMTSSSVHAVVVEVDDG